MSITNKMLNKIDVDIQNLKGGLQPENLEYWYRKITDETLEILPPWLVDKINIVQDPILPLKFNIDISKRAVRYFMQVIDYNLQKMPYTTQLYFLKVQETVSTNMDKSLVCIYSFTILTELPTVSVCTIFCFFSMTD